MIQVGTIVKPQGIRGELKVLPLTDSAEDFNRIKKVFIDGAEYAVLNVRISNGELFVVLKGIADRNGAELIRGKDVFAERSDLLKPDDAFYIVDVIGCTVRFSDGETLGKVSDIRIGNVDYYTVDGDGGREIFPLLKRLIVKFDISSGEIVIDRAAFDDVAFFD